MNSIRFIMSRTLALGSKYFQSRMNHCKIRKASFKMGLNYTVMQALQTVWTFE
jgi:hypothetical protein